MDEIVKAALRKWPTVPHCYGWLALDARGDWYLRDEATQSAGPFAQARGSRIEHRGLLEFIQRNYEADARGCWYFQNGPQRVYVELQAAPWVWRLHAAAGGGRPEVCTAGGRTARPRGVWLDEQGRLFLDCDLGFGLVHSLDAGIGAAEIESGRWQPEQLAFSNMPQRFGYVLQPRPESAPR